MVSESLKQTFHLLTVRRPCDVIFLELERVGVERFLRFLEVDKTDLCQFFFQDLK